VQNVARAMLIAVLFAGSGLMTYQFYYQVAKIASDDLQTWMQLFTGLPFAMACSLRLMTKRTWMPLAVALDCFSWLIAWRLGMALAGRMVPEIALAISGLTGAVGVTLSTGLGARVLYDRKTLLGSAVLGALTGAPFGLIVNRSALENTILAISFPLWQIAVGLWLAKRRSAW
jgi:hypothetical protein